MEGLLYPVGPEEARTYWIRRGAALAVVVVLVVGLGAIISSIGRAAAPEAPVVAEPASMEMAGQHTEPEPGAAGPGANDAVVEEEGVPVPSGSGPAAPSPAAAETPAAPVPDEPATATPAPAAETPGAPAADVSEDPLPPEPANTFHQPAAVTENAGATPKICDPRALRLSAKGPDQVQKDKPVMFDIGITNAGQEECTVLVDGTRFELRIDSGEDRVWSSRDCLAGMPPRGAALSPGSTLEWQLEWRADRSKAQCQKDPAPMPSGSYDVTTRFAEAPPARLAVQVKA